VKTIDPKAPLVKRFGDKASILTYSRNPGNKNIRIGYRIEVPGKVSLSVISPSGRIVKTLVNTFCKSGAYSMEWNAKARSGVYFIVLKTDNGTLVRKSVVAQ
jgi:hypothetical protein